MAEELTLDQALDLASQMKDSLKNFRYVFGFGWIF